jgi:hypothetical protein
MKIFDKGKPLTKLYCESCKKEIGPGEKMIIAMINPPGRIPGIPRFTISQSYFGFYVDDAPKYHEECYRKTMNEKKP